MKKAIIVIVIVAVIGGIYYWTKESEPEIINKAPENDYKNISYNIEGEIIQLKDGLYETKATPDSAEIISTQYFGNEVQADFDNNGIRDVAFILTQSGGGTGVFYYAIVALKTADGYEGINAIFLGDRIAPQTTEFRDGLIIVNYADRKPDEPFSVNPSVGVSKYLEVSQGKLIEVSK